MMNNDIGIKVEGLTKLYKLYDEPMDRLKESFHLFKKKYHHDFHALNNVSFEIRKGEIVGIVGKNGCGKSTLLKIITGVLTPTSGSVTVNGRVSAILELGAGFNPEMTGRDNIYLNASINEIKKSEIENKINEIIDFADIGEHIDQPVKTYSSGMNARLAFALAINVEPDILIIDEALSVGDMAFQEKCILKLKSFINGNKMILFVSHSLPSIRNFCSKAIWIHNGKLRMNNESSIVCQEYNEFMMANNNNKKIKKQSLQKHNNKDKTIEILKTTLPKKVYTTNDDIEISINLAFNKNILDYCIGALIYNDSGQLVTLCNTIRDDIVLKGCYQEIRLVLKKNDFLEGKYFISISIADSNALFSYDVQEFIEEFEIRSLLSKNNLPISEGCFRAKHSWQLDADKLP